VRLNNGNNIFHARPHCGCAVQYANAVPETEKQAKAKVSGYYGHAVTRRASDKCLLFNQSFLDA
jgi:hypothetical protein